MGVKFKKGDSVRQVVKAIEGEVVGLQIVDDEVHYTVAFEDENGEPAERVFSEEQIESDE